MTSEADEKLEISALLVAVSEVAFVTGSKFEVTSYSRELPTGMYQIHHSQFAEGTSALIVYMG